MREFLRKFRRDVLGLFWLAAGLFLGLALYSFRPTDPSLNSVGANLQVQNFCGYVGSFLADLIYQGWGLAGWCFVLACLKVATSAFRNRYKGLSWLRLSIGLLLSVVTASLLALYLPEHRIFTGHIPIGGLFGSLVSRGLVTAFNFVGVSIILWTSATLLFIFYTDRPLNELLRLSALDFRPALRRIIVKLGKWWQAREQRREADAIEEAKTEIAQGQRPRFQINQEPSVRVDPLPEPEAVEDTEPSLAMGFIKSITSAAEDGPRRKVKLKAKVQRSIENWNLPELSMLEDPPASRTKVDEREIKMKSMLLTDKLSQFSVNGEVCGAKPGPAVTMYEFKPNADVKISKITELADDLSLALSSESVRIIAPIPGRDVVGIETSNAHRETVYLKDILANDTFWSDKFKLPLTLGRQADGDPRVVDLRKMPHLMVAGTTGSGKSVFVVSLITGLLFRHSPKTLRLLLVDPKQVDLAAFGKIPHLLMPPICEPKKAVSALKWAIREMEKRYRSMRAFGARNLEDYNEMVNKMSKADLEKHAQLNEQHEQENRRLLQYYYQPQPYIVIVVEEFADLMAVDKQNVEQAVVRLAQMARACGMHLILAMQSPRKDVVTGLIKTNIPGRISFKVASKMDSRIILDDSGAERLLANGDMLFLAPGVAKPQRHHGPWVTETEINAVMKFWSDQGEPEYDPSAMRVIEGSGGGFELSGEESPSGEFGGDEYEADQDEKYDEVLSWVSTQREVSASLLQRRFRLGYPRAARMIEIFEKESVVGPANGSKPRQVLISSFNKES